MYRSLPLNPGVYLFLGNGNEILYAGKAKSLRKRVSSYFVNSDRLLPKTRILISQVKKIKAITVSSEIEALLLEANYIKKYTPKYNVRLADGKAYPLIRITVEDKFPKVLIARRVTDKKSLYFGPFPNSQALYLVLKSVRRIFPYQSVLNHPKKICLYHHLGLCPCPEVLNDQEYKKNIKHLIDFLNGKTKKVIKDLKNERNKLSKSEEFEKASVLQKKLDAINYITNPLYQTFDYKVSVNLKGDYLKKQMNDLIEILGRNGVLIKKLDRIECYDISNISGTNATGSMVVFTNGEKDSQWYRKFKIKYSPDLPNFPNDFAMIEQVLKRRMKHNEWPMPDLIIVDGGKGQVSATIKALTIQPLSHLTIPVIGLAKREETIITSDLKEISLPKNSDALKLVMKIRDEAHRFANSYHRKLRSKNFLD